MSEFRPGTADQAEFLNELFDRGHLIDSGIPGVYGRGDVFERIRLGFDATVTVAAADEAPERLTFPPLLPRRQIEELGYLKSFPHLAGTVFAFEGDEEQAARQEQRAEAHEDWSEYQEMSDLMLKPAGCYPLYPAIAQRGKLPAGGVTADIGGTYVFRHEPSGDPARMQTFQMREIVRVGEPEAVLAWRDRWRDRSLELLRGVGLEVDADVASDPFFGRPGRLLARSQKAQELKFELLVPIAGDEGTAVASFNYHQDHFSSVYGIEMQEGDGVAHTACLGFGLERITLALLRKHGLELDGWPTEVRDRLAV